MEFQDKMLTCATCGREFRFTAREQEFYHEKGFVDPKHCRECRQQRKMRREAMAKEVPVGTEPQTTRTVFEVICAECGKPTQVPFKPLTGKPILCKDCFIQKKMEAQQAEGEPPPKAPVPEALPEAKLEPPVEPKEVTEISGAEVPPADGEEVAAEEPETPKSEPEEPVSRKKRKESEPPEPPEDDDIVPETNKSQPKKDSPSEEASDSVADEEEGTAETPDK
jgi:CxxC-x17-CxxC domain-containing protein